MVGHEVPFRFARLDSLQFNVKECEERNESRCRRRRAVGFYASDQLLDAGFEVDLLDALPTPCGLVRAGVAPDHPKIKSVTRVYDEDRRARRASGSSAASSSGRDIARDELLARYNAVVYAVGTADRQPPRHPGRGPARLARRHGVRRLVQRPSGLRRPRRSTCSVERAVVIGNGNVAIDVARMLVADRRRARSHRHGRSRDRRASAAGVREVVAARPARAGPGRVHQPGAARARRAGAGRRRSSTRRT